MVRLGARDLRTLSACLKEIYAIRDPAVLPDRVLAAVAKVIPSTTSSYNEVDLRRGLVRVVPSVPVAAAALRADEEILVRHRHEHPLMAYYARTRDGQALRISDFRSRRQFHELGVYQELYRRLGVEYQMTTALQTPSSLLMALALNRDRRDFSERDRLALNLLGQHVASARRTAARMGGVHADLRLLAAALDRRGMGIVVLDRDCRVRLMTEQAREWLSTCWGPRARSAGDLPATLRDWVASQRLRLDRTEGVAAPWTPLVVEQPDSRLIIRLALGDEPGATFLYLESGRPGSTTPDELMSAGLTRREAEVLIWVARGKTNRDIGTVLGICERTVDKHLEHVHAKLGVETRTAAVAAVLERLGRGEPVEVAGSPRP